jgi:hypothetical protein
VTCDSFEDAVAEARSRGFLVNNVFERANGDWQANLRTEGAKTFTEFGIAATAHGAILSALRGLPAVNPFD